MRWSMRSSGARMRSTVAEPAIPISVVYATHERQTLIELEVPVGTTVGAAIELAGIRGAHPGIPAGAALGIHGRLVRAGDVVKAGDRVELYRPLPADPKDTRRALAREGRTMGTRRG